MWKFLEKWPFFRADMAGLGKYHMGGYGRIGVYRVKALFKNQILQVYEDLTGSCIPSGD